MADRLEIYDMLGVEPGSILITGIQVSLWGRELLIDCRYGRDAPKTFQLLFEDCQSLQWDVRGAPDEQDVNADVLGIFIGEDDYQESAIITTDMFEIAVRYGNFVLLKQW